MQVNDDTATWGAAGDSCLMTLTGLDIMQLRYYYFLMLLRETTITAQCIYSIHVVPAPYYVLQPIPCLLLRLSLLNLSCLISRCQ